MAVSVLVFLTPTKYQTLSDGPRTMKRRGRVFTSLVVSNRSSFFLNQETMPAQQARAKGFTSVRKGEIAGNGLQ